MRAFPEWLEPMAATLTKERFAGPEWIFERKLDGIRVIAYKNGREVHLFSRNHLPLNDNYPAVVDAIAKLPVRNVIFDGEAAWGWGRLGKADYYVFDILWLDGRDLTALPLDERRGVLNQLPLRMPLGRVQALDDPKPWERACAEGWEGVIAKRRDSKYEHRRSPHWLKMKCEATQELVIGGFTDPQGARVGLGALLLGYYENNDLVFAGKVGTGLDTKLLRDLRARLEKLETPEAPFARAKSKGLPRSQSQSLAGPHPRSRGSTRSRSLAAAAGARVHWVKPEIVVQVAFIEWTPYNKLRHPRLLGLRPDKAARDVVRETAS